MADLKRSRQYCLLSPPWTWLFWIARPVLMSVTYAVFISSILITRITLVNWLEAILARSLRSIVILAIDVIFASYEIDMVCLNYNEIVALRWFSSIWTKHIRLFCDIYYNDAFTFRLNHVTLSFEYPWLIDESSRVIDHYLRICCEELPRLTNRNLAKRESFLSFALEVKWDSAFSAVRQCSYMD